MFENLTILFNEVYKVLFLLIPLLTAVAMIVWLDRRVWAFVLKRRGPTVVGPFGLFQSLAGALQYIFNAIILPARADQIIFILAPLVTLTLALLSWAVLPFRAGYVFAILSVGLFFLFALSSLGVYGIILGGWASTSHYPFLGAICSAAPLVSSVVSVGVFIVSVLLCVGSLTLTDLVLAPAHFWFLLPLLPMFVLFFISALAVPYRPPFDLPEAAAELVAGYQTASSGLLSAKKGLGEYANILLMPSMGSILFLGGIVAAQ
jgi:NADH:ubiquinone oxidoreductase subunit 1 (chain H)